MSCAIGVSHLKLEHGAPVHIFVCPVATGRLETLPWEAALCIKVVSIASILCELDYIQVLS